MPPLARPCPIPFLASFLSRHPKLACFGAGVSGEFCLVYLRYLGIEPSIFLDNQTDRHGTLFRGVPVQSPDALLDPEMGILITTAKFTEEIRAQLQQLGISPNRIATVTQHHLQRLFQEDPDWPSHVTKAYFNPYYRAYFNRKGISCHQPVLAARGHRFPNPFQAELAYQVSFFSEICDFVLPALCADTSMYAEGPGEYAGAVIHPGDVVFDAGANIGLFSMVAAPRASRVIAFEPLPSVLGMLERAQALHPNIEIAPFALASAPGEAEFHISQGTNTCNSMVMRNGPASCRVRTHSIDAFVEEQGIHRVDFIKADIEGAERDLLAGAQKTLRDFAPRLSICTYHLPDDPEVLEGLVRRANPAYVIEHQWCKLYAWVP